jgi:hypothetical protein
MIPTCGSEVDDDFAVTSEKVAKILGEGVYGIAIQFLEMNGDKLFRVPFSNLFDEPGSDAIRLPCWQEIALPSEFPALRRNRQSLCSSAHPVLPTPPYFRSTTRTGL